MVQECVKHLSRIRLKVQGLFGFPLLHIHRRGVDVFFVLIVLASYTECCDDFGFGDQGLNLNDTHYDMYERAVTFEGPDFHSEASRPYSGFTTCFTLAPSCTRSPCSTVNQEILAGKHRCAVGSAKKYPMNLRMTVYRSGVQRCALSIARIVSNTFTFLSAFQPCEVTPVRGATLANKVDQIAVSWLMGQLVSWSVGQLSNDTS